jgi:hypothetical protein
MKFGKKSLSDFSDNCFRLSVGPGLTNLPQSLPIQRPDLTVRGGCTRDTFGYAGFVDNRSVNPRTAATLLV